MSHQGRLTEAISLLCPLAANADALAPGIAQRALLLLVDAYLATHQLQEASGHWRSPFMPSEELLFT